MTLQKIKGNTYYINAATNIGVYSFKNKNCLLVDTGINNSAARKIDEILIESKLHVKYIVNTHSHLDHCGGNHYFKNNYTGCYVYTSAKEKIYMENLELQSAMLFSSYPLKELERSVQDFQVDYVLDNGISRINDEKLEIISLKGHSPGHLGIITPDKVCFMGDSIFSEEIIRKYSLPYLFNISDTINTLNSVENIDADYFVLSHAEKIYHKDEMQKLVDINLDNINKFINEILELLERPATREELLENLVVLNDLYLSFKQYYINVASVSAFIKLLYDQGKIAYSIENGKLYYYRVEE